MSRPQFSLKSLLCLMPVVGLIAHSFWQSEHHRRQVRQLKIEKQMLHAKLAEATDRPASP